jgi:uncharacterized DUF497 family protein
MFEWDEAKNRLNIQQHGIGFAMAARIFEGPVLTWQDDRMDYGEIRDVSIGLIDGIVAVLVVHTPRGGKSRIISARKANRSERKRYEEAIYR